MQKTEQSQRWIKNIKKGPKETLEKEDKGNNAKKNKPMLEILVKMYLPNINGPEINSFIQYGDMFTVTNHLFGQEMQFSHGHMSYVTLLKYLTPSSVQLSAMKGLLGHRDATTAVLVHRQARQMAEWCYL